VSSRGSQRRQRRWGIARARSGRSTPGWLLVIYGVAVVILVAVLFDIDFGRHEKKPPEPSPAAAPVRTQAERAPFGKTARLDDSFGCELSITPLSWRWSPAPEWAGVGSESKMLGVCFAFANLGSATIRSNPLASCWLIDTDGSEWPAEAVRIGRGEPNVMTLAGKHRSRGWFYFAPPRDATIIALVYQPSSGAGDDYATWAFE
jgi:hypothetical protein